MTTKLEVPGATLYFETRGSGPVLLISQSGEGDARRSTDLVDQLVSDYTVVTYDRRGLSRSTLDDPAAAVTLNDHADDVHRLLAEVTDEPAMMLGCSLGAVIGLHVAADHPEQVRTLIAHEPVAPWLLPDAECADHERELLEIQQVYLTSGLAAASLEIGRVLGIGPLDQTTEPDLTPQPVNEQRRANFDFFITYDFTAIVTDTIGVADIRDTTVRVVPATGAMTPRTIFDYRCAEELSALFGTGIVEFPGGHNGNTTHPRGYAARLREVL